MLSSVPALNITPPAVTMLPADIGAGTRNAARSQRFEFSVRDLPHDPAIAEIDGG